MAPAAASAHRHRGSPAPVTAPVTAHELAERLGITVDTLYRTRGRMHVDDKLPAPLTRHRPFRWDRASIDAWFHRHHPLAPPRPANDAAPPATPADETAWRAYLSSQYQPRGA